MKFTFLGASRVEQWAPLIISFKCDSTTRIVVTNAQGSVTYPYQSDTVGLALSIGGTGAVTPIQLPGPPVVFGPFQTGLAFSGATLVELPTPPANRLIVTASGPPVVTAGGNWLPNFAAHVANAMQIDWLSTDGSGGPHDPNRHPV